MANPSMPRMLSSEAPSWDGRAATLRNFLWQVNRLLEMCKITDAVEKLSWLVTYVSIDVREEWMGFAEYIAGDYDAFQTKLAKEFPESQNAQRGSIKQLKKVCKEYKDVDIEEQDRLMCFKRAFQCEANKCLKAPALVSNRELVELFTGALSERFQLALDTKLSIAGATRAVTNPNELRDEDPYDIEEVMQYAVTLATGKTLVRALPS
ncbi:hypothetical protein P691DRAFT_688997 [Macrolepiota fuliginosa MF-IS2]|uniref:Retrotransposon gag domain-containing protein n=1 Tax=Macrolepiota fuliginosa MF-IS2 TaxID=1400762 RepID=A0A9P6BUH7_9AGAR|nr:hypothetical protein P691DRAFT_688997 [Macrolepiota fuliginosa MF-IS2]